MPNFTQLLKSRTGITVTSLVVFFALWQVISVFFSQRTTLPGPLTVAEALIKDIGPEAAYHTAITLVRVAGGFVVAMAIGVAAGIMMGSYKYWENFWHVWVMIALAVPAIFWAVMGIMWIGINQMAPIFAAAMITFPYVALNTWEGVRSVNKELVDMAKAFRVSSGNMIRKVFFPSLMPFIFQAVRMAVSMSWKIVIIAELFGMSSGVGYEISYWYQMFSLTQVIAWTALFTLVMLFIEYVFIGTLERRVLRWRVETRL
jgi:NitT/TauT family transport system permease protein